MGGRLIKHRTAESFCKNVTYLTIAAMLRSQQSFWLSHSAKRKAVATSEQITTLARVLLAEFKKNQRRCKTEADYEALKIAYKTQTHPAVETWFRYAADL